MNDLLTLAAEWTKISLGLSDVEVPEELDDPAWREHPLYRRLAQGYAAWAQTVERIAHDEDADWQHAGRAAYMTDIVAGALSPANFLATNPSAIKRAIDTGGMSVVRGARNLTRDVVTNRGMPSMVDSKPFTVGENLACSPGAVVYREELFELLQYNPTTETVHERPLLFVPPQINRYYIMDLAPGRSLVEFAVAQGMQSFMIVWRNPRQDLGHGEWGLEDYVAATVRAFEVVREITGSEDLNVLGFCAGGMTSALAQAHLAAIGESPVHAATYLVTLMDARQPNMVTTLTTCTASSALDRQANGSRVIDAKALSHHFAWMRPRDLVYGNLVKGWVMGDAPGAFDLLAWNDDGANISSTFTRDSLALLSSDALLQPDQATLLGTPIDLSAVRADNFMVAAQTDHITTWRPCYMTSQLLGGESEMVLINKGHIQAVVSPVAKSRHVYWTGPATGADPDAWHEQAERHEGSWWLHWAEWLEPRSGDRKPAPEALGSAAHPAGDPAPGRYVHEG